MAPTSPSVPTGQCSGLMMRSHARRTKATYWEFAYQIRFRDRKLALDATQRTERFFIALQCAAKDWIALEATKTGANDPRYFNVNLVKNPFTRWS